MIGGKLNHYEITSQLGKGGMGEVYQAKDQKLSRDVAIKVLPEEFARDADRVARFQREAKVLASLNHPNIAAIYGLEESGGTNFLVLELVEGQTLADRIKAGPVPVEEALKLALQIAEALEAAHEKGVIHRDLKPANIKVTPDGKVKVLDFGLAKAFAGEQAELNIANSPTLSDAATQQGIILGTAAYMSPEQAKGKSVDKRADIWAFGVVLFEMLTGRQQFTGETTSETLASVLKSEPEWNRLPQNLHPRIRFLLERCLEKDTKGRYGAITDARVDIRKALADPSGVFVQPTLGMEPKTKLRTILPWAAATLVLGLIIAGVVVWKFKPTEPRQVMRFEYDLPEGQELSDLTYPTLAVSPDSKQFVHSTPQGLYLRSVGEFTTRLIAGSEESTGQPFFSPDGQWVGYFSHTDTKLKKIAVSGGAPVVLCDANTVLNASWGPDDKIVYAEFGKGIMRISASGGTPEQIVKPTGYYLSDPQLLPDGESLLFAVYKPEGSQIVVQSLKSGKSKVLCEGTDAHYLPTGYLVYIVRNSLFAIPFDIGKLDVKGSAVPLIAEIYRLKITNAPQYAVSDSGMLVYLPPITTVPTTGTETLVWVNRQGKEEPVSATPNVYNSLRISPDGKRLALTMGTSPTGNIWIWDVGRETMTRLTFDGVFSNAAPLWTPDGKRIVYATQPTTSLMTEIYWKPSDGTGQAEKLLSAPDQLLIPESWSKDGKTLVITERNTAAFKPVDIGTLSMEGDHARKPLLQEKYGEMQARISPDGRWIAYQSNESGKYDVYVRPYPDVNNGKWQISTSGGISPRWSPDGRELFYRSGDAAMAVPVDTEPIFKPGKPVVLFRGTYAGSGGTTESTYWDISPDGKRFLMVKNTALTGTNGPRKINVVLNWLEELKQRVPTGK